MATLVLTVIGDDRSGLVEALAGAVAQHDGNWNRSSMARLGNKFAGIVEVSVPEARVDDLTNELAPLEAQGLLDVTVERVQDAPAATSSAPRWELRLVGQDRPGIVHEIAHALARSGVSIEELQTSTSSAPMSAEILFEATAVLVATTGADRDTLARELEALANELMVDIELTD
jgi:glycine cleavage system regulatory protein